MAGKNLLVFSPTIGDVLLTGQLLNEILGGDIAVLDTVITTVGNGVLTAAALAGGQIGRTGPVAAYTDTTDTAAAIVTALGGFVLGQTLSVLVKNATAFPETLAGGTGVTFAGSVLNPPMSAKQMFGTVAGTAAAPTILFTNQNTTAIYDPASITNAQATALVTVGAGTITAAGIASGVTTRGGTQVAAFADTTDTAANIIAAAPNLSIVGGSFIYRYVNNTVFSATIGGGTGVTVSGGSVAPANSWIEYLVTSTGAATVSMVDVGQGFLPHSGTVVANGATPVAVTDANLTAGSSVVLTLKTVGGTPHGAFVSAVTPGIGFSINSLAGDTSTYNYTILG